MRSILINGNFLCRNLTGIERFAWEVCAKLDTLLTKDDDVRMLIPVNAQRFPEYRHIQPVISKKPLKSFPLWDMYTVSQYCKKTGAIALNFSNTAPIGKQCGIAFIHDIYAHDFPGDFASRKERLIRAYSCIHYKNIVHHALQIAVVSDFTKQRLIEAYRIPEERISVIGNGWEHITAIEPDMRIFERFPALTHQSFYFTLGSLSKRKNLAWITQYAKTHPQETFAISGRAISGGFVPPELAELQTLPNITLVGYVSDGEVKALMQHCKAFVFPSYYEGFGIPPLEALSIGTPVIVSKSACLPEIYKDAAHYIDADPRTAEHTNLASLLAEPVAAPESILQQYTYLHAAEKLYQLIKKAE